MIAGIYYDILERRGVAASGANYAFAKGSATPTGDYKFGLKFLLLLFMGEKQALPGTNGAQKEISPCKSPRFAL